METKTKLIIALLGFIFTLQLAAQKDTVLKKGMLRGELNLSGGYLFQQHKFASYISGNLEYYINERFSVIGDAWASFDIIDRNEIGLRKNFSTSIGSNYHFVKKSRWDPYIGLSTGIGIITSNYYQDTLITESPAQIAPLGGVVLGLNYYVGSIFHFFFQTKFVIGGVNSVNYGNSYLYELKLSGGLAYNFSTRRKKK